MFRQLRELHNRVVAPIASGLRTPTPKRGVALVRIGSHTYPGGSLIGQLSRYFLLLLRCGVDPERLRNGLILHVHLLDSPVELERCFGIVVK